MLTCYVPRAGRGRRPAPAEDWHRRGRAQAASPLTPSAGGRCAARCGVQRLTPQCAWSIRRCSRRAPIRSFHPFPAFVTSTAFGRIARRVSTVTSRAYWLYSTGRPRIVEPCLIANIASSRNTPGRRSSRRRVQLRQLSLNAESLWSRQWIALGSIDSPGRPGGNSMRRISSRSKPRSSAVGACWPVRSGRSHGTRARGESSVVPGQKTYEKPHGGFRAIGPGDRSALSWRALRRRVGSAVHAPGRRPMDGVGSRRASRGGSGGAEAASSREVVRRDAASWRSSHASISG